MKNNKIINSTKHITEMLELLRRLAAGYQAKEPELGSDIYDQSHELMLETDHYAGLRDEAQKLLEKIEG